MDFLDDYKNFVHAICSEASKVSERELLNTCALGLNEEAGEIAGLVKKHFYHGHPLDNDRVVKELGDVLWYATLGAIATGVSVQYILETNMEKLKKRYGDGHFTVEESLNRQEGDL